MLAVPLLSACSSGATNEQPRRNMGSSTTSIVQWRSEVEKTCYEQRIAEQRIGYVNVTLPGIQRFGISTVKKMTARYVGRMLPTLEMYWRRRDQFSTPVEARAGIHQLDEIHGEIAASLRTLRQQASRARTATQLFAAFRTWANTTGNLIVRGNAVAHSLQLYGCVTS